MKQKQRLLTILMTLLLSVTGAWALDGSGTSSDPYLIGSVQDWKDFAAIVNDGTNPTANAKMTADIDLGTDQTMIGNPTYPYGGVFDGQGYTLTVHLNIASDGIAPFHKINGATIKNLAVAGSVTGAIHCAGLVGGMPENSPFNLISNVMVSATITTTDTHCGGILGHGGSTTNTTIQDCLFNGIINGKDGGSTVGVIWGWQTYGSANIISCLENGTYTNCPSFNPLFISPSSSVSSYSNNYYVNGSSTYGTQATATALSNGTVTDGLNAGRTSDEAVWVQQGSQPMLKQFAVKTDASGAYLIGSVDDWKAFADIVNSGANPAANAKMTADIDLGTDQTRIGSTSDSNDALHYQGVFDGQGHKLTIAYVETGNSNLCAPFTKLNNATIKNLHIAGNIQTAGIHGAGVASDARGTTTIENVWSEVDVTSTHSGWDECSGIVGCMKAGSLTISDCLFSGSVTASSIYNGGFIGYKDSGSASIQNCLSTGTFNYSGSYLDFVRGASVSNSYYTQFVGSTSGMTLATAEQLADGTIAYNLQAGRTGDDAVWVQQGSQPMLKTFAVETDESGNYLIGSVDDWKAFADIVKTTPNANAKMTADIDLGTDQTMVGNTTNPYTGTFDGYGHTMTIAYNVTEDYVAPFRVIGGATIQNLHVNGTITTTRWYAGGIAGNVSSGTNYIRNTFSSVSITGHYTGGDSHIDWFGGLVGQATASGTKLYLTDCFFNGSITGSNSSTSFCANMVGIMRDYAHTTISNCLSVGTFTKVNSVNSMYHYIYGSGSTTNSYVLTGGTTTDHGTAGTVTNASDLADGSTTSALNAGRVNGPWVQDAVSGEPRLDLFMATTSVTAHEGATGEYWSTYYDGAKSSIADANTTVYTGKVNGNKIALTEVTDKTIPAGNAVILKSTAANMTLTKTSATGTLADNDLKGVDVATAKTDVYCLNKKGTVVGFYKFTGDVPAHRAYIEIVSSAPMLGFDNGETTSLSEELREESATTADEAWYSLDGRQLNSQPTRKGIYVKDGKKVVIK